MQQLLRKLQTAYPAIHFAAGEQFCWSPETQEVYYKLVAGIRSKVETDQTDAWSLLHETGHALLEHASYRADLELLRLEVAAWDKARELATQFGVAIDEEHVQDCLDTYRDWLHKRSICPNCRTKCLQQDDHSHYRCFNCHTVWRVTTSRFCRAYRTTKNVSQLAPVFNHQLPFAG
jgi:hypothetical protein